MEILFKISTTKVFDRSEATVNYANKRITKNKLSNKRNFCDRTIKLVRDLFSEKLYHYYLNKGYSNECIDLEYNISKSINILKNYNKNTEIQKGNQLDIEILNN